MMYFPIVHPYIKKIHSTPPILELQQKKEENIIVFFTKRNVQSVVGILMKSRKVNCVYLNA